MEKGTTSAKSDIYSFGVLVLEIVTGQRNRDFLGPESSTNLLNYVSIYCQLHFNPNSYLIEIIAEYI